VALWGGGQDLARIAWDQHPEGPGTLGGAHVSALQRQTPDGWRPRL
jgi:hypothetical protein